MITRALLSLSLVAVLLLAPWVTTLIVTMGKPLTFALLAPLGFVLGVTGTASVLERSAR